MAIKFSPDLKAKIDALGIQEEEILFLTIKQYAMHLIRHEGKRVEYRDITERYLNMLFTKDKSSQYVGVKPKRYLLLQGGYSANSPRMLVELKGWVVNGVTFPEGADFSGYEIDDSRLNLVLGERLYDTIHYSIAIPKKQRAPRSEERVEIQAPKYLKPINTVEVTYQQTGESKKTNAKGMREMQARAYAERRAKYLLIKAPPASGKSRALMFIALDKMIHQGISKTIVAVPERSIGRSFRDTNLIEHGFEADWRLPERYDLCRAGGESGKIKRFREFLESDERILLCTHATLRFAFEQLEPSVFDKCLVAVDEFHHISADTASKLGNVVRTLMNESEAHLVAMTGSYFRGDSLPVLMPEDEEKFTKVTYTYYEQLNGYEHLKSIGIGYHLYTGRYYERQSDTGISAIEEILDESKKTIVHIPSVNAAESSKEKLEEVGHVMDCLGEVESQDRETGVFYIRSKRSGRVLRVVDLVEDTPIERQKVVEHITGNNGKNLKDIDIIIALGMAKEGFDWPECEHAITIGYRGSLTEVVQIIGRTTRDSEGKTHAQFTNLIAKPDALDEEMTIAVNNMLKAITASLLMEQVLAPKYDFKPKELDNDGADDPANTLRIEGFKLPTSARAKEIIDTELNEIIATVFQDNDIARMMASDDLPPEYLHQVGVPMVIREKYPDLNEEDYEAIQHEVSANLVVKHAEVVEQVGKKFLKMANTFVNIEDITIDLIERINPFQKAFAILSTAIDSKVLRTIQDEINYTRIKITEEEAMILWPKINLWYQNTGKAPDYNSRDGYEKRLGEALLKLRKAVDEKRISVENDQEA